MLSAPSSCSASAGGYTKQGGYPARSGNKAICDRDGFGLFGGGSHRQLRVTRTKGRRKIRLERIRVNPARRDKGEQRKDGETDFPLAGERGSAPIPH